MIHIDSPESPMYQPLLNDLEKQKRLLTISESRMHYHAKDKIEEHGHWDRELYKRPLMGIQKSAFYVELGLGQFADRPYQPIYLVLDTASNFTWTQCEGCSPGFYQIEPLFRHGYSRSFRPCRANQCPYGSTRYRTSYADGTRVGGFWATDTLAFPSLQDYGERRDNYLFLCADGVNNFVAANNGGDYNKITGILGMGRGPLSVMSQIQDEGYYAFSYCLPRKIAGVYGPIFLKFGTSDLQMPDMSYTRLLISRYTSHYYVGLLGISLDDKLLDIPSYMFPERHDGSGGTIIDSGSQLTYLIPTVYNILLREFTAHMLNENPHWSRCHSEIFYACWAPNSDSLHIDIPQLTLHFANGNQLVIEQAEVMLESGDARVPYMQCLTVNPLRNDGYANIIGYTHQTDQLIVYDLRHSILYFMGVDCSNNT